MQTLQTFLSLRPVFLVSIGLLSVLVGSFLNVLILRLPRSLRLDEDPSLPKPPITVFFPPSHCPHCLHSIRWYDNVPILAYGWLKGRCRDCQHPISLRYPLVEFLTLVLSLGLAWMGHFDLQTLCSLVLVWGLIALAFIDIDWMLLPDTLTLPLLWMGLCLNSTHLLVSPSTAIWGAILGYGILWSLYWIFKGITGKEGMGYGDFKLLALLGAWLGWEALPFIILIASILGTGVGLFLIGCRGQNKNSPIPFGPFLAIAGYFALVFKPSLYSMFFLLPSL